MNRNQSFAVSFHQVTQWYPSEIGETVILAEPLLEIDRQAFREEPIATMACYNVRYFMDNGSLLIPNMPYR
jgi:hypothetical protein